MISINFIFLTGIFSILVVVEFIRGKVWTISTYTNLEAIMQLNINARLKHGEIN